MTHSRQPRTPSEAQGVRLPPGRHPHFDLPMEVASRIVAAMFDNRVSYEALADALGWTLEDTADRLTGDYDFDLMEIAKIEAALGADVLFVTRDDRPGRRRRTPAP